MGVSDATIETAVTRLSVHYKGSFTSAQDIAVVAMEYARCLERMPWCDDDTFFSAVDHVIDTERTNGFLPEWSLTRGKALSLCRSTTAQRMASKQIEDTRRRGTAVASLDDYFHEHNKRRLDGEREQRQDEQQGQEGR